MESQEYCAWVKLALTPYIGPESFLALLAHYGSAQAVWSAPAGEIRQLLGRYGKQAAAAWEGTDKRAQQAADAAIMWSQQDGCRLLLLCEHEFPERLSEGITPPPLLFARGDITLLQKPAVAIVGSRHATPQALRIARDFGQALAEQNVCVVSGMAAGIDTAAHEGALKAGGSTIAFWGTGIDRIYPPANRQLAYRIAEQGLVLSEFPLDTRPLAGNFPRRNRLIAALSQAVLVVEAALESGSLITARLAAEMGREVLAVPGSIDNPHAKGCHRLIKDGAKLVESLEDILQECPQLLQKSPVSSYPIYKESRVKTGETILPESFEPEKCLSEKQVVVAQTDKQDKMLNAMGYEPVHPDWLAEQLQKPAAEIYKELLERELAGEVAAVAGGRYQRIKPPQM